MSEMLERVARAIADDGVEGWKYETVPDFWRAKARAAIAAMREPTEAMFAVNLRRRVPLNWNGATPQIIAGSGQGTNLVIPLPLQTVK